MWFSLAVLLCCLSQAHCLFFIMGEREERCFYNDYTEDATVTFRYNGTSTNEAPTGVIIQVRDPLGKTVLQREYGSGSSVSFKVEDDGEYAICVSTTSTKWAMYATDTIRVSFKIDVQYPANQLPIALDDEDNKNKKGGDEMDTLERKVQEVLNSVTYLTRAVSFQRQVEEKFRTKAEVINNRVFVWALVQLAVLLLTGWFQMQSLKNFFIQKKLV